MDEWNEKLTQGTWAPKRYDDHLSRALGKPDHPGRVRGFGGQVRIRDVFGRSGSKTDSTKSFYTYEDLQRVKEEAKEAALVVMRSEMRMLFAEEFRKYGITASPQTTPHVPSSVEESMDPFPFANQEIPLKCHLALDIPEHGNVIVADGTLFKSTKEDVVHHERLLPHHARVSVDEVRSEHFDSQLPVPSSVNKTIGSVEGSFVMWPNRLVQLENQISSNAKTNKRKESEIQSNIAATKRKENETHSNAAANKRKENEIQSNIAATKRKENEIHSNAKTSKMKENETHCNATANKRKENENQSDVAANKGKEKALGSKPVATEESRIEISLQETVVQKLGDKCRHLYDCVISLPLDSFPFAIDLDSEVFRYAEKYQTFLSQDDIIRFMKGDRLDISIIHIYLMCLAAKVKMRKQEHFGFMCPDRCSETSVRFDATTSHQYMTDSLVKLWNKIYVFLLYHQGEHWVLLVLSPSVGKVLVFDPTGQRTNEINIRPDLRVCFQAAFAKYGKKINSLKLIHMDCPIQSGITECGYYVMRYMYDIVEKFGSSTTLETVFAFSESTYPMNAITEVTEELAKFVMDTCLS